MPCPPGVMINSELLGFECRVSQPYNLPTHELTRFVKGVEFTNCFKFGAEFSKLYAMASLPPVGGSGQVSINAVEQPVYLGEPVLQPSVLNAVRGLQFEELRYLGQGYHCQQVLAVVVCIHLGVALGLRVYQCSGLAEILLILRVYPHPVWPFHNPYCGR